MSQIGHIIGYCFAGPVLFSLLLSGKWKKLRNWGLALAAIFAIVISFVSAGLAPTLLPNVQWINALNGNWAGKIVSIGMTLVVFGLLPKPLKREAGLFVFPHPPEWRSVFLVSGFLLVIGFAVAFFERSGGGLFKMGETLAFMATLPGIDEEFCFRGTVLALLVAIWGKPWCVAGIKIGWGALPVVCFFGLAHGFTVIHEGCFIIFINIIVSGIAGIVLLWLKERTGSIWVPVIVHNLFNFGSTLIDKF